MAGRQTGSAPRKPGSITTWSSPPTSERCNRSWPTSRRRRTNARRSGCASRFGAWPNPGWRKKGSMAISEKSRRVLVVDDNRDGADAMGLLVEELGNQVHVTYGGTQALDVANAFRPDLMLVDLVMPEMDCCGLVTRLRQSTAFAQTRIVAITGEKGPEDKSSAMKAGVDTGLFNPVS